VVAKADDACFADNPVTGQSESVWKAIPRGGSGEIFFSVLQGTDWLLSEQITSNTLPDENPRLAISGQGVRWVSWWRDDALDAIYAASKPSVGGPWSTPAQLSPASVNARYPDIAVFGGTVFIAYETIPSSGNRQIIVSKQMDPLPWPSQTISTALQANRLFVQIHQALGRLWVDWVDSGQSLGWSEYVSNAWSAPQFEPYGGSGDLDAGRARIRNALVEP
jgi:hypothetical protein